MDAFKPKNLISGFVKSQSVLYNPEAGKVRVTLAKNDVTNSEQAQKTKNDEESSKPKKQVRFQPAASEKNKVKTSLASELEDDFIDSDNEENHNNLSKDAMEQEDESRDVGLAIEREIQKRKKNFDFKKKALNRKEEQTRDYGLPTEFMKKVGGKHSNNIPTAEKVEASKASRHEQEHDNQREAQYGKGFKILQLLGYKAGMGLGKTEQGIVEPIQATKQTMIGDKMPGIKLPGIKAKKDKEKSALDEIKVSLTSDEEEEDAEDQSDEGGDVGRKRKDKTKGKNIRGWQRNKSQMKYLRKTQEKIKGNQSDLDMFDEPINQQKIVDLRGSEAVYYENYTAISNIDKPRTSNALTKTILKNSYMAEVPIILRTALDKVKHTKHAIERRISSYKDTNLTYSHELHEKVEANKNLKAETESLRSFARTIGDLEESFKKKTSEEVLTAFEDLLASSPKLFANYSMERSFIEKLSGKLKEEYARLDLKNDEDMQDLVNLLKEAKEFLEQVLINQAEVKYADFFEDKAMFKSSNLNLFDSKDLDNLFGKIVENALFPAIRSYIVNQWQPQTQDALLDFFDKNKPLIPEKIKSELFDNYLMPKLEKAVDAWNPTKDKMPIHLWVHPWLPVLSKERLSKLWKPIQFKISQALQQWEPQDESALKLLMPWFRVFDEQIWENIIMRCIIPKLAYHMRDLSVDPEAPNIEPLQWLLAWQEFVPVEHIRTLIEGYLISQLHKQWDAWIKTRAVPRERMLEWLSGWKDLLGRRIFRLDPIARAFQNMEKQA